MALVPEDGTGLATANTYGTRAEGNTYFAAADRPSATAWTGASDAEKDESLLYSTRWMDRRYAWRSTIYNSTAPQALALPRDPFYDEDGRLWTVAMQLARAKEAQFEAALAHLGSTLAEVRDRGGAIESVAAGSVEVVWTSGASAGRTFPYIDSLVAPLVEFASGRRLVRG